MLIAHTLLAGFYLRIAQVLNDYYKQPVLGIVFLIVALLFAVPLSINLLDLWARTVASVREEKIAEKILQLSINIHRKLFGKGSFLAEKLGMLGSLYYDMGKMEESEKTFQEAWENYTKSAIKFPFLHPCFSDYKKLLESKNDTEVLPSLQKALNTSSNLLIAQKMGTLFLTAPIIAFLLMNQGTERSIAKHNAHGQVLVALKEITGLADLEASFLGEYARCKVYKDYAIAFDETDGQLSEMVWCANRAAVSLKKSGVDDDYTKVLLLNLQARGVAAEGKKDKALEMLTEALALSSKWGEKGSVPYKYDFERERTQLALAELYRTRDEFDRAEALYKQVLGLGEKDIDTSKLLAGTFDPVETIDRLHKLQHIEAKLGKKDDLIKLQKKVCEILETSIKGLSNNNKNSAVYDFGVRESARELDIAAIMLADAGRNDEAKDYQKRAEKLRATRQNNLKLDAAQQDSIVDASTKLTTDLLAVKYRAGDCKQSLNDLFNNELKSDKARGALERQPWYDAAFFKDESKLKDAKAKRRLEVDISPLSIRSSREGDGIAVDVSGTVKIFKDNSQNASEEQRFGFAYILKAQAKGGKPSVEDLLDNQVLATFPLE